MPHDDPDFEPVLGLPETPPEGETILWQGAPRAWPLAKRALNAQWVALYFGALALWRGSVTAGEFGPRDGLIVAFWYVLIGAVAVGVLALIAWSMARATVYTLTTHRVAMRIGAALTVTLNLPYRWIGSADLAVHRDGTGTITLDLTGETRLSYLVVWPHVKPWSIGRTVPALRCIPEPEKVARLLAEAAATRVSRLDGETGIRAASPVAAE